MCGVSNAALTVNGNLELGHINFGRRARHRCANGTLNILNGTANINNLIVGAVSITNNVTMNNAKLTITNSLATNASGLFVMTMTNSVLGLNITDTSLKGLVQTLTTGGTSNLVQLASVPVFVNYPAQIALIKYTTLNGTGFNFGLTNPPATAPGAFLSNNLANKSIDLYLPVSPAPVITGQPQPFSGSPGSTVTLSLTNTGNLPLSYQWYYTNGVTTNALTDANPGPSGSSTVSGSTTSVLMIANAQTGDSGGYFAILANTYGSITSSVAQVIISTGGIAPAITGPNNQTSTAGTIASISAAVSGSPVPSLQWQFNGVNLAFGWNTRRWFDHRRQHRKHFEYYQCAISFQPGHVFIDCGQHRGAWRPTA